MFAQLIMNRIYGYLPMKIMSFVSNLHIVPRPIYLTCHGESMNDLEKRLGGILSQLLFIAHCSRLISLFKAMLSCPHEEWIIACNLMPFDENLCVTFK